MVGIPSGQRAVLFGRPQRRVTGALRRTTHKYIGNSSGQLLDSAVNVEILFEQAGGRDAPWKRLRNTIAVEEFIYIGS